MGHNEMIPLNIGEQMHAPTHMNQFDELPPQFLNEGMNPGFMNNQGPDAFNQNLSHSIPIVEDGQFQFDGSLRYSSNHAMPSNSDIPPVQRKYHSIKKVNTESTFYERLATG